MKNSKLFGLIVITLVYVITTIISVLLYNYLPIENVIIKIALLDAIATIIVFLFSLLFNNASVYDPYWSVAPVIITVAYFLMNKKEETSILVYLFVILVILWGLRLTINCYVSFKNIKSQDWRYTMIFNKHPKLKLLLNFFGIHLMPTIVVFIGLMPGLLFLESQTGSFMTIISLIVMALAIIIEAISDIQMKKFRKDDNNKGKIIRTGLWKNSRHPNYFGEILFWVGVFLTYFSSYESSLFFVTSPLIMFLLFSFVSIPMMEKRQLQNKTGYKEYMEITNALLPILPPNKK